MNTQPRKTSLFWPVLLVGAGVILLLRNFGVLQELNFHVLLRLWPLILVVIGLDLIFGHRFPWAGALIGVLTVGAAILFLYYAPGLGIDPPPGIKTEVLSTPKENTERVVYNFDTSSEPVFISALADSDDLFNATIVHRDQLNFNVAGEEEKTVSLSETTSTDSWFTVDLGLADLKWDIGLAPGVPTAIQIDGGSGALKIDLDNISLESMTASLGSGASSINLPATMTAYDVNIDSGSGAVKLTLPSRTEVRLEIASGSGAVTIQVPPDAEFRLEVLDDGSGSVYLPDYLELVQGSGSFENDTWQTAGYEYAASRLTVRIIERGSGSIYIKN